ncbi:hypothetical protein Plim_3301 [Planctopirus limnophila DSM 3776]|uniref:Uncharacterized protein n=1 Tax=Planctopirus limnophila (strain ATCC 43296 / DSM 3776 / IFAM 1008 / Mu 290) TaxID=521674 RepID=D5SU61_PLAL2|nr:hypothetical protein Plim_3301 [Planctopirus limnophila DSM 3776]
MLELALSYEFRYLLAWLIVELHEKDSQTGIAFLT